MNLLAGPEVFTSDRAVDEIVHRRLSCVDSSGAGLDTRQIRKGHNLAYGHENKNGHKKLASKLLTSRAWWPNQVNALISSKESKACGAKLNQSKNIGHEASKNFQINNIPATQVKHTRKRNALSKIAERTSIASACER
ncbi:hypothetical protein Tco_0246039 [Tanacetum coccineum]